MKRFISIIFLLSLATTSMASSTPIVPLGDSPFYYQVGGGEDFSLPASMDTDTVDLRAEANINMGMGCAVFNPAQTFENYFNSGQYQAQRLSENIVHNATAAITEWPMYELSKIDPSLYNLLSNNMLGANEAFSISTKSCERLKSEIDNGQNPYQNFASISVNHHLKKEISLAASSQNGDVVSSMENVDKDGGDNGLPWVAGKQDSQGNHLAGGKGQPLIYVIHDSAIAGYNVIYQRALDDKSNNGTHGHLSEVWQTPESAASWIVTTLGDIHVSTCQGCQKSQRAGKGLRFWLENCEHNELCKDKVHNKLDALVKGSSPMDKSHLLAVSAPGVVINAQVIKSIQSMPPTRQMIVLNKLSQEVAAQAVFDKALLARRILTSALSVPVIAANAPATSILQAAIANLDKDIQSMVFEHNAREAMMSQTLTAILNYQNQAQARSTAIARDDYPTMPHMQGGAVMQGPTR